MYCSWPDQWATARDERKKHPWHTSTQRPTWFQRIVCLSSMHLLISFFRNLTAGQLRITIRTLNYACSLTLVAVSVCQIAYRYWTCYSAGDSHPGSARLKLPINWANDIVSDCLRWRFWAVGRPSRSNLTTYWALGILCSTASNRASPLNIWLSVKKNHIARKLTVYTIYAVNEENVLGQTDANGHKR